MQMYLWIVMGCLVSACAIRQEEPMKSNPTCSKDDLGVDLGDQCTTFKDSTGLGTDWVAPLACAAKSFSGYGHCGISKWKHRDLCEKIFEDAGFKQAEAKDIELSTLRQSGAEFIIGDGLYAVVYWTTDSHLANGNNMGAIIGFRWQERGALDAEQAFHWFAQPGARTLKGFWLPNVVAQAVAGAKDHKWVSSAADLVKAVQAVVPGKRIAFTGFSVGSVCAQLMSIAHTGVDEMTHPAVVFGGNGVQHVLGLEIGSGPFQYLLGRDFRETPDFKETKAAFHPYIYNFIDPGDEVPRIDCQMGAVCVLPESVAGNNCTKDFAAVELPAHYAMSEDCPQCSTHFSFMEEDKFLTAFYLKGPSHFDCVAGPKWTGASPYCYNQNPKIAD